MNPPCRSFFVITTLLLVSCDKLTPPAAAEAAVVVPNTPAAELQLAEARDALQRQALEIETKTALMEKQLAQMEQALKDRDNAELRGALDALKKQNDVLRVQADAARRQSSLITPRVHVTPAVSAPRDYSMFYQQLAPYGRWMDVSGYGYCWRPTLTASPGWRPYVDGCWVWSALGWTWQSNEPFGWAVYHYGRWVNLARYGWVWVPGSDWAPAWVAWRQSRDYIGWAPLPPDRGSWSGVYRDCDSHYNLGPTSYVFITTNHFVRPSYTTVCAPVVQNTVIFQSSVNNTQIVRRDDHVHGNVFVHHGGPPRAQMEHASGAPVPQRQVNVTAEAPPPRDHAHGHSEAMPQLAIVELPAAKADAPPVRPHNVEHIDQPKLVSGFEGVPQRAAAEIRETIAEEKATAVVQQPAIMASPPEVAHHRHEKPVTQETVRPAIAVREQQVIEPVSPPVVMPAVTPPVVVADPVPAVAMAPAVKDIIETKAQENSVPVVVPLQLVPVDTAPLELVKPEQPVVAVAPVIEPEKTPKVEEVVPSTAAAEKMVAEQAAVANAAIEAEKARVQAVEQQAQAAAMQQRQQQEAQERLVAEKLAADQAAEAEKARMQAAVVQQQEALAAQQRMAADQAAAENAKARQQAEAAAMQQQQEQVAAQQRATAERMAAEQAAAEQARQQQAEAAAMQRQQEEAARRAEEQQQMRVAQQEAERRAQEMAQRQAEEQARRTAEEQLRAQQEAAQRAAQEMAQRQAEEAARRAQEEAQRAAAEAAARAAAEAARNQPQPAPQNPGM